MKNIVMLGAGNVATHLGMALKEAGYNIVQVFSRTERSASQLAGRLATEYTNDIKKITSGADIYIIAVKDGAITTVVETLQLVRQLADATSLQINGLIVHTSGTISIDVLKDVSENIGVFYPLQTFSKNVVETRCSVSLLFKNIPICIEANNKSNEDILLNLAGSISENVHLINTQQRKLLHLAAVFACNFSNHMYAVAEDILKKGNLPFDMLKPLIIETANKIENNSPNDMQTGPAIRGDQMIMVEHLEYLAELPEYREMYKLISESIST
ncbi:MAG: Rossmann-like and DUF2520 domain-containing protein [Bacteroidota bacterium]